MGWRKVWKSSKGEDKLSYLKYVWTSGPLLLPFAIPILTTKNVDYVARKWVLLLSEPDRIVGRHGTTCNKKFVQIEHNLSNKILNRPLPSWTANSLSSSRCLRAARCFSSRRNFSSLASSHLPSSMRRWSGRNRESVGAKPSSISLSWQASSVKL